MSVYGLCPFSHSLDNQIMVLQCADITVVGRVLGQTRGQAVVLDLDTEDFLGVARPPITPSCVPLI